MVQPQQLDPMIRERNRADLDVEPARYFGKRLARFDNIGHWNLLGDSGTLTRHSYVFQVVYKIGEGDNAEYGGIQLRARVHGYSPMPEEYRRILEETAHRAAHLFNSSKETSAYINGSGIEGTAAGSGYLEGFNPEGVFRNWEKEPVSTGEADIDPGVVDWSVEIYEDDNFEHADLAGIAQGVADPYWVETRETAGEDGIDIPPTKWVIQWQEGRDPPEYAVRPKPRTAASKRYSEGAGAGKTVYVNNKPIGSLGPKGRVWLRPEYERGDERYSKGSWGTYWSREGLVQETGATYQAIRKGGVLYQTSETEGAIHLKTSREKPDGWRESDPNSVPINLEARSGSEPREYHLLRLRDPDESFTIECRRDEAISWALGKSDPVYEHLLAPNERWEPSMTGDPNHPSWGGGGGR